LRSTLPIRGARITMRSAITRVGIMLATPLVFGQASRPTAARTGYAPVNGLKDVLRIHGSREPLTLLHAGAGATGMVAQIMLALSRARQVIAVDLQAHGHTADTDRPLSIEAMADDIAALIKYLNIERADVMGYSLCGEVALQTGDSASRNG